MANWEHCPGVERDNRGHRGLWVFKGTGVPLYLLYHTLASGATVNDFAQKFNVDVEQAAAALNYEADELHDFRLSYPQGVPFLRAAERQHLDPDDALWRGCPAVEQDPGRLGGVWVFLDSRLPLHVLHYNLAGGATVDEFVEWFDGDKPRTIIALEHEAITLREVPVVHADTV